MYESLFEMKKYNEYENIIEKPFIIRLKEQNLEVDAYGLCVCLFFLEYISNMIIIL